MKKIAVITGVSMIAVAGYIVAQQQGMTVLKGDVVGGSQSSAFGNSAASSLNSAGAFTAGTSSSFSAPKYCCITLPHTCLKIYSPAECGNDSKNIYDTEAGCDSKCVATVTSSAAALAPKPMPPPAAPAPVCPNKGPVTVQTQQSAWYFQAVNIQYPDYGSAEAQAKTNVVAQLLGTCSTNPTAIANIRCDAGCTGDGQPSISLTDSRIDCLAKTVNGSNGAYCSATAKCTLSRTCKKI